LRKALFLTRAYARLFRPALAELTSRSGPPTTRLARHFSTLDPEIDRYIEGVRLAA
jgi:hypothetical protein